MFGFLSPVYLKSNYMNVESQGLALITGAATRIGRALAVCLADEGYQVGIHYHKSQKDALQLNADLESVGHSTLLLQADLTREEEVQAMFAQIKASGKPLKVLVNSAAVMIAKNLLETELEIWDQTLDLNLRAPWLCSRQAAHLMADGGGIIINISDSGAHRSWTGYGAYIVSKAALESLTRVLARTLAPQIRVNAIAPGLILKSEGLPDTKWNELVNRLPLKQAGDPQDIVDAMLFLIKNHHITGTTLVVDGGYQLL